MCTPSRPLNFLTCECISYSKYSHDENTSYTENVHREEAGALVGRPQWLRGTCV